MLLLPWLRWRFIWSTVEVKVAMCDCIPHEWWVWLWLKVKYILQFFNRPNNDKCNGSETCMQCKLLCLYKWKIYNISLNDTVCGHLCLKRLFTIFKKMIPTFKTTVHYNLCLAYTCKQEFLKFTCFTPHWPVSSRVLGCEKNLYFERWNSRTHPPI